ncbi:hypothetical protein KSP39_PZI015479 [Platanthera zijinensis]|uniref:Uncharacterized protein n=1 Tax=Platanthera zijinensis TaxID=2320716 RepID=A0AAP0B8L7_9ASPA
MTMPDMGLVISSCYNVAVVHFLKFQSFTFLPLYSAPPITRKTIYIGFVNNNHFIQLLVQNDCPMPPVISLWTRYHTAVANQWDSSYKGEDDEIVNLADP